MTRWDSPLFTVPFDDEKPPLEEIWEAMIGSEGKAKVVKPNQATIMVGIIALIGHGIEGLRLFYRNRPPNPIISTNSTRPHKRYSISFWTGRRTILAKAEVSLQQERGSLYYLQTQSHCHSCKGSGGNLFHSTVSIICQRAEYGVHSSSVSTTTWAESFRTRSLLILNYLTSDLVHGKKVIADYTRKGKGQPQTKDRYPSLLLLVGHSCYRMLENTLASNAWVSFRPANTPCRDSIPASRYDHLP